MEYGKAPGLAVLLIGDNEASQIYVNRKIKACQQAEFQSYHFKYPRETSLKDLKRETSRLKQRPSNTWHSRSAAPAESSQPK